jgi:hypothetical protein
VTRLGAEAVEGLIRKAIAKSAEETRFRPRAIRIDSTVVTADIRRPTDSGLAAGGIRLLARFSRRQLAGASTACLAGEGAPRVTDRSRRAHARLRHLGRSLRRRTDEAKKEALGRSQKSWGSR